MPQDYLATLIKAMKKEFKMEYDHLATLKREFLSMSSNLGLRYEPRKISPPEKLDPRYFNKDGTPTSKLIAIADRVRNEYSLIASPNEEILGKYIVGSVAAGNFHPNSDLDIAIWAKVGYHRGKELAYLLCDRINQLSQYYPKLREMGIDPENVDEDLLVKRGLMEKGEHPSLIKVMDRLGLIRKADMIDVTVWSVVPWGRVYDLEKGEWVKYRDGDQFHPGPISEYFRYGF